jgi:tryptophan halogenase
MIDQRERAPVERRQLKDIVILGSGCCCWMSACYLKQAFPSLNITVLEESGGGALDLFEDTGPGFQNDFCDVVGLSEADWMRRCDATFKVAEKLVNWRVPRSETPDDHYYRLYDTMPTCSGVPLADYWSLQPGAAALEYACYRAPKLLDARLAPRDRDGSRAFRYAWQFDARLMSAQLRATALSRGVHCVADRLARVEHAADGSIASLVARQAGRFTADLFIDCSGFRSRLIDEALGEPFLDMSDYLPCDRALSLVVFHDDALSGVDPYTSAIALKAGWAMKVPLLGRFGTHYFYCSDFASDEQAAFELCSLWELPPHRLTISSTKLRVGRYRRCWVKNCVSVGRSSGFVEPLDVSHVECVTVALQELVKHLAGQCLDPSARARFNEAMAEAFDGARDLTQAHYATTPRADEPFWRVCRDELLLSTSMKERLQRSSFWSDDGYDCILAAMGRRSERRLLRREYASHPEVQNMFEEIRRATDCLYARLPTNYELLQQLHG